MDELSSYKPDDPVRFKLTLSQAGDERLRERLYGFLDYRRKRWQRNAGLRIDHLLRKTKPRETPLPSKTACLLLTHPQRP